MFDWQCEKKSLCLEYKVDNKTKLVLLSDGETTIGIQYESGRVVISTINSYWVLSLHPLPQL